MRYLTLPIGQVANKGRNENAMGNGMSIGLDGVARDAGSAFRIAHGGLRRRPQTHFNATGERVRFSVAQSREPPLHATAYLKLGIMYDVHLYIARSMLIFAARAD